MVVSTGYLAAGASIVLGLASFPFRRYSYWSTWNRWWLLPAGILYLVVHALAGLVGAALAAATDWHPTSSELWNGLLYGVAGAALMRIRLEDFGFDEAQRSNSALGLVVMRLTEWMDELAEGRIKQYLDKRDDGATVRLVQRLDHTYVRPKATPFQLTQFTENVTAALKDLKDSDPIHHGSGRETLRGILLEWYTREHITERI
jgi:hypothetical protein